MTNANHAEHREWLLDLAVALALAIQVVAIVAIVALAA